MLFDRREREKKKTHTYYTIDKNETRIARNERKRKVEKGQIRVIFFLKVCACAAAVEAANDDIQANVKMVKCVAMRTELIYSSFNVYILFK